MNTFNLSNNFKGSWRDSKNWPIQITLVKLVQIPDTHDSFFSLSVIKVENFWVWGIGTETQFGP